VRSRSVGIRAWARLLGLEKTVVEAVDEEDGAIVVAVRPRYSQRDRCPHCRCRCPGYDLGEGRRRWRALDLGTTFCFLEADAPRVSCKRHAWWWRRCRGRATMPGSRAPSMTKPPGLRCTRPRPRSVS
jgi:transposase